MKRDCLTRSSGRVVGSSRTWVLPAALALLAAACQRGERGPEPPPTVAVAYPIVRTVTDWDEYTGRAEAIESIEVRARVSGYLKSIHFEDGAMVEKDELLFVIDPRPYEAELGRAKAELELARARLELARKDLARAEVLMMSRAISEEETDAREAQVRQAEASLAAAEAAVEATALDVEFTHVVAPVSGRVGRHLVDQGNLVSGGADDATLLTTIVTLDPIHVYFEGDERAYLKYTRMAESGERASSRDVPNPVWVGVADEEGFPRRGWMDFVDNKLDPSTGTMLARAVVPNPDLLLSPGLFVRVRLAGSSEYEALLVPDAAIGIDQAQRFVWVISADDRAEYRRIRSGTLHGDLRVVRDGLSRDDRVVVAGVQRVRPGAVVVPEEREIEVTAGFAQPGVDASVPEPRAAAAARDD